MKISNISKSLFIITLATTSLIGGSFALWSDTATSTGNIFSAGSLDLKLTDANETAQDSVTASFGQSAMVPGGAPVSGQITIANTGTIAGSDLDITIDQTNTDTSPTSSTDLASFIEITALSVGGSSVLASLPDSNTNGFKDLNDLATNDLLNQGTLAGGASVIFAMTTGLKSTAPSHLMGDSTDISIYFTLNQ